MIRLQQAIAAINAAVPPTSEPSQLLVAAKCRGLIAGYHERWKDAPYVTETVEEMVESELWNPDTQRKSRSFRIAGKIDWTGKQGNRQVIFDHKTTSDDISDPASPYWRQLVVEAQPSHYMLLLWLNERKVDDAVWDVIRKPGISPKALSKHEAQAATFSNLYCGHRISEESIERLQYDGRETLEMYEARLAQDCTKERPDWYFQRRSIPRLDTDIHEHAVDLWGHSQDILHARRENRYPRNSGACMLYRSPCKFLGLCSGHDSPDSDNWRKKANVHTELPMLAGDGRDVLTNSCIKVFQTCRKKFYFEYVAGIERQDEEEREALFFGNIWHLALESYFSNRKKPQGETNGNHASGSSLIGGETTTSTASEEVRAS
jgi:hypothetical protein